MKESIIRLLRTGKAKSLKIKAASSTKMEKSDSEKKLVYTETIDLSNLEEENILSALSSAQEEERSREQPDHLNLSE